MKLYYSVVAKRLPKSTGGGLKYYPFLKRESTLTTEQISKNISATCGLRPAQVQASIIALSEEIQRALGQGQAVQLDQIGTFSLMLRAKGAPDPKALRSWHIKRVSLHFHPSARFKSWLKTLHFSKSSSY